MSARPRSPRMWILACTVASFKEHPNIMAKIKCPNCGRLREWSTQNPWRPFCSERCRSIDLGEWFNENRVMNDDQGPENSDDVLLDTD